MDSHNPFGSAPAVPAQSRVAAAGAAPATSGAPSAALNMSALLAARQNALGGKPAAAPAPQPAAAAPMIATSASSAVPTVAQDLRVSAAGGRPGMSGATTPGAAPSPNPLHHVANPHAWAGQGVLLQPHWAMDVTAAEIGSGGAYLKGEVMVFRDVECYLRGPLGQRVPGLLTATTYQVRFSPTSALPAMMRHLPLSAFAVPVASIRKIDRPKAASKDALGMSSGGPTPLLDITCKDVRVLALGFRDELTADKMASHLKLIAFPPKVELLHAFAEGAKARQEAQAAQAQGVASPAGSGGPLPGWDAYNARAELERQGVLGVKHPRSGEPLYRVTDINATWAYAPTYPAVIVSPSRASDTMLQAVASFRSKARIPALTWMHPGNKTSMWRCSQPRVGMGGNTNQADEQLLAMIRESNVHSRDPHQPLLIADCRPRANAMANKAGGWGYEVYPGTTLEFLNIHNIHAVRDSHRSVESLCLSLSPNDVNWAAALAETGWLYHLRTVLSAGLFVAEAMHRKGQNVLVHCSDGWDRTAQVCGLVQLMLDPYFRTVKGFAVLVMKDWASFGHKFGERAGHREEKDGGDISPCFVQFLDAVWQLMRVFPSAFEFDGRLLLYVAHHVYACRFGDFLANCERERAELGLAHKTPSLWGHLMANGEAFRNPGYNPSGGDVMLPHPAVVLRNVTLWSDWFLRWSPFPSAPAECRMEKYAEGVYNRAPVAAAAMVVPAAAAAAAVAPAAAAGGGVVGGAGAVPSTASGGGASAAGAAQAGGAVSAAAAGGAAGSAAATSRAGGEGEEAGGGASPSAASEGSGGEGEGEGTSVAAAYLAHDDGDAVGEQDDQ